MMASLLIDHLEYAALIKKLYGIAIQRTTQIQALQRGENSTLVKNTLHPVGKKIMNLFSVNLNDISTRAIW